MRNLFIIFVGAVALQSGSAKADQILTYRAGDRVPITVKVGGDLAETKSNPPTYMTVKKDFWIKLSSAGTEVSLDGVSYLPYKDVLDNTLTVEPVGQDPAGIAVGLMSYLK